MMTITATQLKQQSHLLDRVAKEDILITKHNRPFAVIVGIDEYNAMKQEQQERQENPREKEARDALENVIGMLADEELPDPVEWQIKFREENESDPWKEVLDDLARRQ
jgi:prevent-host-death family protein